MATTIYFAAARDDSNLSVTVEEGADDVFGAWTAASPHPFALTERGGRKVWVNPATIAYWREQRSGKASVHAV